MSGRSSAQVAPARERGLKLLWNYCYVNDYSVAPARERGLKYLDNYFFLLSRSGRSREGAWIEMRTVASITNLAKGRSREGAWIEIPTIGTASTNMHWSLPRGSVD